jgi:hypothetical protein
MSIVTNMIRSLGIIGSHLPRTDNFERRFIRAVSLDVRLSPSKVWASPRAAEQFQRYQMAGRVLDESMARLLIAR